MILLLSGEDVTISLSLNFIFQENPFSRESLQSFFHHGFIVAHKNKQTAVTRIIFSFFFFFFKLYCNSYVTKDRKQDTCSVTGRGCHLEGGFVGKKKPTTYVTGTSIQDFRRKPMMA